MRHDSCAHLLRHIRFCGVSTRIYGHLWSFGVPLTAVGRDLVEFCPQIDGFWHGFIPAPEGRKPSACPSPFVSPWERGRPARLRLGLPPPRRGHQPQLVNARRTGARRWNGPPVDICLQRDGPTADKCQQTNRQPGGNVTCIAIFTRIYSDI